MPLEYSAISFQDLPGWDADPILEAVPAFLSSATAILQKEEKCQWYSFYKAVQDLALAQASEQEWRAFLQKTLAPYRLSFDHQTEGLFTGYYEPLLNGSLKPYGQYQTPLYQLPPFDVNLPRSKIVSGALAGKGLELVWVDDPIDAFFLQIQGSGRVRLENDQIIRLGYAGTNKHPYYPIGKSLIQRGLLDPAQVSLQTIKRWLWDHPDQAEDLMSENSSYVFFKILSEQGPLGTQGVPLTPRRSLAVDQTYYSLGSLMWIDLPHPTQNNQRLQQLMVAQDTGGAIKGGLRGDYFWGFGQEAEYHAGKMNVRGTLYAFLPI